MNIKINKNFEKEYKEDAARGFTLKEIVSLIAAFAVIGGGTYLLYKKGGIEPEIAMRLATVLAVPMVAMGFYTYQEMSPLQFLTEYSYFRRTSLLTYAAGEITDENRHVFTMKSRQIQGISAIEMRNRKKEHRKERNKGGRKKHGSH